LGACETAGRRTSAPSAAICCCTLSYPDSTLSGYWSSDLETEYNTAGQSDPGYVALDEYGFHRLHGRSPAQYRRS
jgi:hypothetical protein